MSNWLVWLILSVSMVSMPALALDLSELSSATSNIAQCPTYKKEFSDLLARANELYTKVKNPTGKKCSGIASSLQNLSGILDPERRKSIEAILKKHDGDADDISADDLSAVSSYSEEVATTVKHVIGLFSSRRGCVESGDRTNFLQNLASISKQFSGLSSTVTGPYGAPLALLGETFGGIITGINGFLKNGWFKKSGYDFDKPEHRELYRTNLCIYHDMRKEISRLTRTKSRMESMKEFHDYLTRKVDRLANSEHCSDCKDIKYSFDNSVDIYKQQQQLLPKLDKIMADENMLMGQKCEALGRLFYFNSPELSSIRETIRKSKLYGVDELASYHEYVKNGYQSIIQNEAIIRPEKCSAESSYSTGKLERSIAAIRAYIDSATEFFNLQAQKKHESVDGRYGDTRKNGKWLYRSAKNLVWVEAEMKKLASLEGTGTATARVDVDGLKYNIESILLDSAGPEFLAWYHSKVKSKVKFLNREVPIFQERFSEKVNVDKKTPVETIVGLIKDSKDPDIMGNAYSEIDRMFTGYNKGVNSIITLHDYCNFYRKSGFYRNPVSDACDKFRMSEKVVELLSYEKLAEQSLEFIDEAKTNSELRINADWFDGVLYNIKEWFKLPDCAIWAPNGVLVNLVRDPQDSSIFTCEYTEEGS